MIGQQLRRLRKERGLSLRALATQVGVSPTLLSQVERGLTEPSLATVRRVAEVFGESVSSMFDDQTGVGVWVSRPGERSTLMGPRGKVGYERLTPGNGQLEVLRAVLAPGETSSTEPWSHASIECTFVLLGLLTVEIADRDYSVAAGESITFDSRQAHRYVNKSEAPTEYVCTVTPPNP